MNILRKRDATADVDDGAHREFETAWRRRQRPENEVPTSVAIDAVLADDHEVVVFIAGARVFSNGVDFTLEVRARHATTGGRGDMLGGVHGDGDPSDRLLLGFEFSDRRPCTNIGAPFPPDSHDSAERPLLTPGGGSGGTRSSDISLFLSPLPPLGDLRIVCAWPKFGLPEKITSCQPMPFWKLRTAFACFGHGNRNRSPCGEPTHQQCPRAAGSLSKRANRQSQPVSPSKTFFNERPRATTSARWPIL